MPLTKAEKANYLRKVLT